jgi:hypothetical protein
MVLISGIALIVVGSIYLLNIFLRKGERFEYAGAMFFQEFGLMFVASAMLPSGRIQLFTTLLFALSMLWTMFVWRKLFREFQSRTSPR